MVVQGIFWYVLNGNVDMKHGHGNQNQLNLQLHFLFSVLDIITIKVTHLNPIFCGQQQTLRGHTVLILSVGVRKLVFNF